MNELEFQEKRRQGIGASDAGPICGFGFIDAETLFRQKIGLETPVRNDRMLMGLRLEPIVASLYEEKMGCGLATAAPFWRSKSNDWQFANLDRVSDAGRIVELKCVFGHFCEDWGSPMTDEVPDGYLLQVQHQMGVTSIREADIAALSLVTGELRVYRLEFRPDLYANLTEIEAAFWDKVQRRDLKHWEESRADGIRKQLESIKKGYRLDLDPADAEGFERLVFAWELEKERVKLAEAQEKDLRNQILQILGPFEAAYLSDGRIVRQSVSEIAERTQTVKAHVRHSLRVTNRKEQS